MNKTNMNKIYIKWFANSVLGYIFLNEQITFSKIIGIILIFTGIVVMAGTGKKVQVQ